MEAGVGAGGMHRRGAGDTLCLKEQGGKPPPMRLNTTEQDGPRV